MGLNLLHAEVERAGLLGLFNRFQVTQVEQVKELVLFLESAGKLVPATGGFQIATDKVCGQ